MPNRTVYIRIEDLDKWNALENKSEWLHKHLNLDLDRLNHLKKQLVRVETKMVDNLVNTHHVDFLNKKKGTRK